MGGTGAGTTFSYRITVPGTYNYQCSVHGSMGMTGSFTVTSSGVLSSATPKIGNDITMQTQSLQGRVSLLLSLPRAEMVSFDVVDVAGQQLMSFASQKFESGVHRIPLRTIPNGFYIIKLIADNAKMTNACPILR